MFGPPSPDPTLFEYLLAGAALFGSIVVWAGVSCCIFYGLYFLITLPMRRTERARLFLDLLEMGLKDGQRAEEIVLGISSSRDRSLGMRLHRLAGRILKGLTLGQALKEVPMFLPPRVVAMLNAGERIGNIAQVLPAARTLLRDSVSQVHASLNYVLLLLVAVTPVSFALPIMVRVTVIPKYVEVFRGMVDGSQLPAFSRLVFSDGSPLLFIVAIIYALFLLLVVAYVGGPRLRSVANGAAPGVVDRFLYLFPWRRNRLQRDFSVMLALLLDAGVPESEAVRLAGEAVDDSVVRLQSLKVLDRLSKGSKLTAAIQAIDSRRDLQWRLTNALRRGSGFLKALAGWHETLDAKAYQQEQAAAQLATTTLVLLNGLLVGSVVIAVFVALIGLIDRAILW